MSAQQQQKPAGLGVSKGTWSDAEAYEPYIGRWSRLAAREFVAWLAVPGKAKWLDLGCGTGALSEAILKSSAEAQVISVDRSESYLGYAKNLLQGGNITFLKGDAQDLQFLDEQFDAVVSGLMMNFVADAPRVVGEMSRVARRGCTVACYIWDYAEGMEFLRALWAVAFELDPTAIRFDEGHRSPIRHARHLDELFRGCGLADVETRAIYVPTNFANFDEYWTPFLGGQGTVASYVCSLDDAHREELRRRLRQKLVGESDGPITFTARAWAVRGKRP